MFALRRKNFTSAIHARFALAYYVRYPYTIRFALHVRIEKKKIHQCYPCTVCLSVFCPLSIYNLLCFTCPHWEEKIFTSAIHAQFSLASSVRYPCTICFALHVRIVKKKIHQCYPCTVCFSFFCSLFRHNLLCFNLFPLGWKNCTNAIQARFGLDSPVRYPCIIRYPCTVCFSFRSPHSE